MKQIYRQKLIAKAIEQIKEDIKNNDISAIADLLANTNPKHIQDYLSEFDYIDKLNKIKETLKKKLIAKLMRTKFKDDRPEMYDSNLKYLNSLSIDEMKLLYSDYL